MKKRIVALLLMMTMVLSMVSCGKKDGAEESKSEKVLTVADLYDKAAEMDAKTADITMEFDLSGISENTTGIGKIGIKMASVVEDKTNLKTSTQVSYRLGDAQEYTPITTVICDNKTIYMDYATLKKAAIQLLTDINQTKYLTVVGLLPDATYVKFDEATMKQYVTSTTGEEVPEVVNMEEDKVLQEVIMAVGKFVGQTIEDATKDVNPAVITGSKDGIKVLITKENLGATCEAFEKLDLNAKYDELISKVKEVKGADQYVKDITESKTDVVKTITDSLKETKTEIANFKEYNMEGNATITGEAGKREYKASVSMKAEDNKDRVEGNISVNTGEEITDDRKVVVPEDATDFNTFMQQIATMFN